MKLLRIRWSTPVDLSALTDLFARSSLSNEGGAVEIRAPKYGSERTVFLASELVKLLARHVELLPPRARTVGYLSNRAISRHTRTRSDTAGGTR